MEDEEILYLIALSKIPLVGPILARQLISKFGSAKEVMHGSTRLLLKTPMVGPKVAANIRRAKTLSAAERELVLIKKNKVQLCTYLSKQYPYRLKQIADAPLVLYYEGDLSIINNQRTIGIVGTRSPTAYGIDVLNRIMDELKLYQPTIISGLAYGIDTHAHRLALQVDLPTFGILGNGLKNIYPRSNYGLAQKMKTNGGIISEFTFESQAEREHFPMRNRIIAALSDALIVVESKKVGGSMITADFANQYHKDVFAIPGRVNDPSSEGPNFLIKSHRANLLNSVKDLSYVMGWEKDQSPAKQQSLFVELNDSEQIIVDLIRANPQISLDILALKANMRSTQLASTTLNLEFKGIIRPLPGKRFTLI